MDDPETLLAEQAVTRRLVARALMGPLTRDGAVRLLGRILAGPTPLIDESHACCHTLDDCHERVKDASRE